LDPRDGSKAPIVEDPIDLNSLQGAVSALAFDGKRLLLGAPGGVFLATGQDAPRLLAQAVNPVSLSRDGGDLYFADKDNSQVWMVHDYAGDSTPMLFADERSGLSSPAGIRVWRGQLLIANSGNHAVDSIDISTRAPLRHVDVDFAPARMEALGS